MEGGEGSSQPRPGMAWFIALLMIAQVVCVIGNVAQPVNAASGRAMIGEVEPNDDYVHAQPIVLNTTVKGAMDINNDNKDVFKVHILSSTVVNISLIQKEWNPAQYSDYSANVEFLGPAPYHSLIRRENGNWPIKTISVLCIETGDYYVWLYLGANSKPVNYTMNIMNQTVQVIGRVMDMPGDLDATMTNAGTNPNIWYRLSIPPTKGIQVTMFVPPGADFDIMALDQWDQMNWYYPGHRNPLWLNASTDNATGNIEFLKAEAWSGQYWLRIKAWPGSKGTYKLRISDYDPVDSDGTNTWDQAKVVTKKVQYFDNLQMSFDHFDWYKVFLAKGQKMNVTLGLQTNTGDVYNISIYDSTLKYLTGAFDTVSGDTQNDSNPVSSKIKIKNFTSTVSGDYYVMAMPVRDPNQIEQASFRPLNSDYSIMFDLQDQGPANNRTIAPIVIPEDTNNVTLDLSRYFKDPENNPLTYSFMPSYSPNITVSIASNGTTTIKPIKDWCTKSGPLPITFRADDPYANTGQFYATAATTITVTPDDDPPTFVGGTLPTIEMNETEKVTMSGFLYDFFKDVDDTTLNFSVKNNGSIPVQIDNTEGKLTVGPVDGWIGSLTMNVTARDGNKANPAAWANLTVTVMHKNHQPVIVGSAVRYLNISENQPPVNVLTAPWFLDKDVSYANDHLTYSVGSPLPANLLFSMNRTSGLLKLSPAQDWTGQDTIWVVTKDDLLNEAKLKLIVNVVWVNQPPKISTVNPSLANQTILEGTSITFKVVHVNNTDTNQTMSYTWYVEGTIQGNTTNSFNFVTDNDPNSAKFHAGFYKVRVEVSDGKLTDSFQWELTVTDVNLPPTNVKILSPTAGQVFTEGQTINLKADLAKDIENDPLTYTWRINATNTTLGTSQVSTYKDLKKGSYTVVLIVDDGHTKVLRSVNIVVKAKPKGKTPGFEGAVLVLAVVVALVAISRRKRR